MKPNCLYRTKCTFAAAYGDVRDWMKNTQRPVVLINQGTIVLFLKMEPLNESCNVGWFVVEDKVVSRRIYQDCGVTVNDFVEITT
jgi:hypothetical protein